MSSPLDVSRIPKGDPHYPPLLDVSLRERAPDELSYIGNIQLLNSKPLALFCSKKCPGSLILKTYEFAQKLREAGTPVIGGFHSPVERECLNILLRGKNGMIICPARGLDRIRIPKEYQGLFEEERLLLLSALSDKVRRTDAMIASFRNSVVAALSNEVFVAHAEPGSKTLMLCKHVIEWKKRLYTVDDPKNDLLFALGAKPVLLEEAT